MDCSLPGSSVHEILQARILEWVAISFSCNYNQCKKKKKIDNEKKNATDYRFAQVIEIYDS